MMVPISITILATLIFTNGAHARAPMEPHMDNNAINDFFVRFIRDDTIAELDKLSAPNKYLDKVIAELEDIDNLLKDGSVDAVAMPVSYIFIHRIEIKYLR